ncbi:ABC transporter permease [Streptococcus tangpeifui]|uniref:ABC transporter permease n=1 Tax=Streptococcus tangpeifui TaxID=2709400 RepID=UPI0013EDDDCF|nr:MULTISPECIES: ABC transporter permease [unclassified Streptococcus]
MALIKIELLKLRRARFWLPLLVLPLLSVVYGSVNFAGNIGVLKREWLSLWTQVYLFYGSFFFPGMIGIVCAYIWNSEHKRNSLKLLLTSAYSFSSIVWAKIIVAFGLILISQLYFLSLYAISGLLFKFEMAFPTPLLLWAILASLFSVSLVAIQTYLSLRIKSFAPPVALAMVIGVFGFILTAQHIVPELGYVLPFAKLAASMNQMTAVNPEITSFEWLRLILYTVLLVLGASFLQIRHLKKIVS